MSKSRKGQMFVVTAVFLTGLLFTVQQALIAYSLIDLFMPFQTKTHYMVKDAIDSINETIRTTDDCYEFERNLKELLSVLTEDFGAEGHLLETTYNLNCTSGIWDNEYPEDSPLTMGFSFTGTPDAAGTKYRASGVLLFYHIQ